MPAPMIAYLALIAVAQPAETVATTEATAPAPVAAAADGPVATAPGAAAQSATATASAAPAPAPTDPAAQPPAHKVSIEGPVMQDIIVVGPPRPTPQDPYARMNAQMFAVVRDLDGAITEPAALAMGRVVPKPVREGVRNVFDNLDEPIIAANFLLQLHPGKAIETLLRFTINSTIGWAGLFDVAGQKYINLPRRPNGFADTLGYYGVKPGPYLYLPMIGPTNPRDMLGGAVDLAGAPLRWIGGPFKSLWWQLPVNTFTALNTRLEFQEHLVAFREGEHGIYVSEREWYRRLREARIAAHKAGDHGPPVIDVPFVVTETAK